MEEPNVGWHPDPSGRFEYRYFNGQRWTSDVASDGRRAVDGAWVEPSVRPPGRGLAVASMVVALCSAMAAWVPFVFVPAAAGAVTAFVLGLVALRRGGRSPGAGRGMAVTGVVVAPVALALCTVGLLLTVQVVREVDRYLSPGDHRLTVDLPCTVGPDGVRLTGTIRNLEGEPRSYRITVEVRSDGRVRLVRVTVPEVAAGATASWVAEAPPPTSGDVSCRVREVRGPSPFGVDV